MPYLAFENTEEIDGFCGIAITVGYVKEEKTFQIALTIGTITMAIGFDFSFL